MAQVHVVPGLLGWSIKVNGKRIGRFGLQADADNVAVFLAKLMTPASLKLHGRRGRILSERTYDRKDDPPETPG